VIDSETTEVRPLDSIHLHASSPNRLLLWIVPPGFGLCYQGLELSAHDALWKNGVLYPPLAIELPRPSKTAQ
jgi:hypothetical protein